MLLRGAYGLSLRSLIGRHLLQWTASPWTTEASTRKRVKRITIIRLWWLSQWLVTHGHHPAVTIYLHVAPSSGRHRHIWNRHVQPSRRRCHSWEQQDRPYNFCRQYGTSDSVTRVTLRKMVTRLDSCFSQNASNHNQWVETRVRVIFTISLSSWWTNPDRLHTKKWAIFASVMIKIGGNFLFCLSSLAALHFKDQMSPTCKEGDLTLCFQWGVSKAQYIDTLSWFNAVFTYRDHGSGPVLWPRFFSRYE